MVYNFGAFMFFFYSQDYLRPLFKLCRERQLNEGILENLTKMMGFMKEVRTLETATVYSINVYVISSFFCCDFVVMTTTTNISLTPPHSSVHRESL